MRNGTRTSKAPRTTADPGPPPESARESDRAAYSAAVRRVRPLDDEAIDRSYSLIRPRVLARGTHLLRAGEQATSVFVVVSGLLREFFVLSDGTERSKAFIAEGEFSGSLADLLSGHPSRAFIVAEETTRVLVGPYAEFRALESTSAEWLAFGRTVAEGLLLRKAEREFELLGLDATERYARFAERYPGLEARVSAKHVASYLGITPVHLSRLRRARLAASRSRR